VSDTIGLVAEKMQNRSVVAAVPKDSKATTAPSSPTANWHAGSSPLATSASMAERRSSSVLTPVSLAEWVRGVSGESG
jgi:hypothetical protein